MPTIAFFLTFLPAGVASASEHRFPHPIIEVRQMEPRKNRGRTYYINVPGTLEVRRIKPEKDGRILICVFRYKQNTRDELSFSPRGLYDVDKVVCKGLSPLEGNPGSRLLRFRITEEMIQNEENMTDAEYPFMNHYLILTIKRGGGKEKEVKVRVNFIPAPLPSPPQLE